MFGPCSWVSFRPLMCLGLVSGLNWCRTSIGTLRRVVYERGLSTPGSRRHWVASACSLPSSRMPRELTEADIERFRRSIALAAPPGRSRFVLSSRRTARRHDQPVYDGDMRPSKRSARGLPTSDPVARTRRSRERPVSGMLTRCQCGRRPVVIPHAAWRGRPGTSASDDGARGDGPQEEQAWWRSSSPSPTPTPCTPRSTCTSRVANLLRMRRLSLGQVRPTRAAGTP